MYIINLVGVPFKADSGSSLSPPGGPGGSAGGWGRASHCSLQVLAEGEKQQQPTRHTYVHTYCMYVCMDMMCVSISICCIIVY